MIFNYLFISLLVLEFQGPLFQQRPYPSPGAVLRKNAEIASQKKKPNSNYAPISKRGDGSDGLGDADWNVRKINAHNWYNFIINYNSKFFGRLEYIFILYIYVYCQSPMQTVHMRPRLLATVSSTKCVSQCIGNEILSLKAWSLLQTVRTRDGLIYIYFFRQSFVMILLEVRSECFWHFNQETWYFTFWWKSCLYHAGKGWFFERCLKFRVWRLPKGCKFVTL